MAAAGLRGAVKAHTGNRYIELGERDLAGLQTLYSVRQLCLSAHHGVFDSADKAETSPFLKEPRRVLVRHLSGPTNQALAKFSRQNCLLFVADTTAKGLFTNVDNIVWIS